MSKVVAIVWDFDKTLISTYMQEPIFKKYGVDGAKFWEEVNALPKKYLDEQNVKVNKDTIYLNHILNYVKEGKFKGLNNAMLEELGKDLVFYSGIPEIFEATKNLANQKKYNDYDIKIEHYIVSTGLAQMIKGSIVYDHVEGIWGCELIEDRSTKDYFLSEIGYTIDNTSKTRAIFEINKGINKLEDVDVNDKIEKGKRRVPFENIIYIADGPSDIPAFSLVKSNGGNTFAIYPAKDKKAFKQVEKMRNDGRIDMFAEANFSEDSTSFMWITGKVQDIIERIYKEEKANRQGAFSSSPKHLTEK